MNLIAEARALMALLAPLTGNRALGDLTVNADAGPATVPPAAYAVPILGGAVRYDLLLKTRLYPSSPDGYPVTAGTAVPVVANVGGTSGNLPPGTPVRWFPTLPGIEPVSVVGPGGIVGGTLPEGLTAVRQVAFFEELGAANGAEMLAKALVSRFPAIVLAWESTGENTSVGRGQQTQLQVWSLYIVTSRLDADPARRLEGMAILDAATELIAGRTSVDGFVFSGSGLNVVGRQLVIISDTFYVYRIRLTTQTAIRWAREGGVFNPWEKTRLDEAVPVPVPEGGFPIVNDYEFPMPQ